MATECVERREAGFYLTGSRVPIDRIVWDYRNGEEPETIQSHYPTLSLEQVRGAIAFYETHREAVDESMAQRQRMEADYDASHPASEEIRQRFEMRRTANSPRASSDSAPPARFPLS